VPGSIGSVLVERPASIEEGFSQNAPLVYHYGHVAAGVDLIKLFFIDIEKLKK
jgi:polyribonucleotide 5'-hydroxyl-kinase